ncbi:MAG: metal ABC transporter substrate-binding protein [Chloroflexota bacterium]|nr:metal ABC transporter substrate-binding protein [Chloroflexota bacterium]
MRNHRSVEQNRMKRFVGTKRVSIAIALSLSIAVIVPSASGAAPTALAARGQDAVAPLPTAAPLPAGIPRAEAPLTVATTTGIIADLVAQVGGPRVEAASLLPPNADPHDFEPSPDDVVAIERASILFRHGLGLDHWADQMIETAGPDRPVVVVSEGIPTIASEEEEFSAGDPHIWLDPTRTAMMVERIEVALVDLDPEGAATYQARAAAYTEELTALDRAIHAAIGSIPAERRKVVTNHDALGYYAERYGLTVVGTVLPGLDTTAEPSAREIAALIELMEREGVTVILAENTNSPELAEELASQTGATVVDDLYTDSLGPPGSGAETYLGLMRIDTARIVAALA